MDVEVLKGRPSFRGKTKLKNTLWIPQYCGEMSLINPTMDNFAMWLRDKFGKGEYCIMGRRKNSGRWFLLGKVKITPSSWRVKEGRIIQALEREREEKQKKAERRRVY